MSNTICRFFQTNSCRYGNRCRFKHVYEEQEQYYDSRNQKSGSSILKNNTSLTKTNYYPQQREEFDLKRFTEEVAIAVKAVEEQGIWPLSCFGCIQSCGNVEGFEDISPEELRWKAYEARATGKFPIYIEETQVLLKKAAAVRSVFLGKGPTATSILRSYYLQGSKKENTSPSGTNVFASASSPFSQNTPSMPTSSNVSPFRVSMQSNFQMQPHQQQQLGSAFNTNVFGRVLQGNSHEMQTSQFSQPVQRNIFGQPVTGMSDSISALGQNQLNVGTDFFKQNLFGSAIQSSQPNHSGSVFFQPQVPVANAPFAQSTFGSQGGPKQVSVNVLYSQIEDLTPDELEQYKATTFSYGKTPLKPPPKELC